MIYWVKLWDWNDSNLNEFRSIASIPLIDLVSGNFKQTINFTKRDEKQKADIPNATIYFKINFEEVWDFYLTFMDWKASSIQNDKNLTEVINPKIELKLLT
jgi:hypothetical protein